MKKIRDPQTPQEWQEAVDSAEFFLALESAKQYGLVTGGPEVNADRADAILRRGKTLGYKPKSVDELCKIYFGRSA